MTQRLDPRCRLWCLLATGLAVLAIAGCGLDEKAGAPTRESSIAIDGLFPSFDPAKRRYVSRCGRGAAPIQAEASDRVEVEVGSGPPETGAVSVDPGVGPGEDFEIAVTEGDRRRVYEVRCLPADFPAWRFETSGRKGARPFRGQLQGVPGRAPVGDRLRPRGRAPLVVQPADACLVGTDPQRRDRLLGEVVRRRLRARPADGARGPLALGRAAAPGQDEGTDHRRARASRARQWQLPGRLLCPRNGGPAAFLRPASERTMRSRPSRDRLGRDPGTRSARAGAVALELARAHLTRRRPAAGGATC